MPPSPLTSAVDGPITDAPRALPLQAGLFATLAVGLAILWWGGGGWVFPLDDAYITLHNAAVLREGVDRSYGVPALTGATSLVHLALVTAGSTLLAPVPASYLVSSGGVLLFASGLLTLALRQGLSRPDACLVVLLGLVTAGPHLLNGLETGLVMAAITWVLVFAADDRRSRWTPVACGLLPFLRPELGLLSVLLLGHRALTAPDRRAALAGGLRDLGLAAAAAAPWLAWTWIATGAIVPQTMAAKLAFFAPAPLPLPAAMVVSTVLIVQGIGPVAAALLLVRRDPIAPVLWTFAGLFVLGYAVTAPSVLDHNGYRYATTLLPIALAALCRLGLGRGLPILRGMIGLQCAFCLLMLPRTLATVSDGQALARDHAEVAAWAGRHLPPDAHVLIHDAGMIAYATRLPLTDLVGLKSPDSIADHRRWTAPSHGADRMKATDAIARRTGATHAIVLDDRPLGFWAATADDLRHAGWRLDPLFATGGQGGYRLYRIERPRASGP